MTNDEAYIHCSKMWELLIEKFPNSQDAIALGKVLSMLVKLRYGIQSLSEDTK